MYKSKVIVDNTEVPCIKDISIKTEPLWGDGTGRKALDGHYSGRFIGYFTSMTISFSKTTDSEFNLIKKLLEHPFLEGVQFSLEKDMGSYKQGDLYTEDFYNGVAIDSKPLPIGGYWEEFSVTLTAIDRRS